MIGFIPLVIAAYFIWRANEHMDKDEDVLALFKLCLGMFFVAMLAWVVL